MIDAECFLTYLVIPAAGLAVTGLVMILLYLVLTTKQEPDLYRHDTEKVYRSPAEGTSENFPSIDGEATIDLSIVVPAYNEEERLPVMMDEALEYLEGRQKSNPKFKFEIIVVDDGSKDKTTEVALGYTRKHSVEKVRVLTLFKNKGKGGAIRAGVRSSRGNYVLFADADGATTFEDISKLLDDMEQIMAKDPNAEAVCFGSRAHLEKDAIAERSFFRTILMKGFHFLVWFFCVRTVQDTQCGFKLMSRSAARVLFSNIHIERWAFDVEMFYIAEHRNMELRETAVRWQEIEGSKVVPFWVSLQMGRDLVFIRLRYTLGLWKLPTMKSKSD